MRRVAIVAGVVVVGAGVAYAALPHWRSGPKQPLAETVNARIPADILSTCTNGDDNGRFCGPLGSDVDLVYYKAATSSEGATSDFQQRVRLAADGTPVPSRPDCNDDALATCRFSRGGRNGTLLRQPLDIGAERLTWIFDGEDIVVAAQTRGSGHAELFAWWQSGAGDALAKA